MLFDFCNGVGGWCMLFDFCTGVGGWGGLILVMVE